MQRPKVVLLGAGSYFFGMGAIWQMVTSEYLNGGTLSLVDTDETILRKYEKLARMAVAHKGVDLKIEAETDRRKVLEGADFVILSFAKDSAYYRGIDCEVSAKYGIRMCSGDTIGPGGIFRTLRELPEIMRCVDDVRELCPNAFLINYINPTAVNGKALQKYAPDLKTFALCDGLHMPRMKKLYAQRAGIIRELDEFNDDNDANFDLRVAGINHFTWVLKATYRGKNVMANIADALLKVSAKETEGGDTGAKRYFNEECSYSLYKAYNVVPAVIAHTKEYVRFWQGRNILPQDAPPLGIWDVNDRYVMLNNRFAQLESYITGEKTMEDFFETHTHDHATDIIENIVGDFGKCYYINTTNNGAVSNMHDDAFIELLSYADKDGIHPLPVGEMPLAIRGMQELVADVHEVTVDAVIKRSKSLLRQALLTDPLTCAISDTEALMEELLEREKDAISITLE